MLEHAYKVSRTPFSDLMASYSLTLLHFGRRLEATPVLRKAVQEDPAFINKRLAAGNEEFKSNDLDAAVVEYVSVLLPDTTKLTPEQTLFVQFNVDFKSFAESKDPATATVVFVDTIRKKLGDKLVYDEIAKAFSCMVSAKQFDHARNLYNETIILTGEAINQDTLDRKFLGLAYGLSSECPDILTNLRVAFIRLIKSLYNLNEEDAKPIYALHEFVLKQGLISAASEITSSFVNGTIRPENRFVRLADAFLKYRKIDDAVGTFDLMIRKKNLEKSGYGTDLTKLYSGLLRGQKDAEAQDLMKEINSDDLRSLHPPKQECF